MTEPCDLTALEARRLIGRRKLSPVELLESCLKRIGEVNHAVNAVVALDEDRARVAAKEAEAAVMRQIAWKPRQHLLNNYWMQLVFKKPQWLGTVGVP